MLDLDSNAAFALDELDSPIPLHSNASAKGGQAGGTPATTRKITCFPCNLRAIPLDGGETILRLFEDPLIEVDHDRMECKVRTWDTVLPLTSVEDIGRTLGRRFLELYSKSVDGRLTEQEEASWFNVVQLVDYQSFCVDRTPTRYVEGSMLANAPACTVEWHDGQVEVINPHVARKLNVLNPGDRFGAWVKWGRDNNTQVIEGLKML